MRRRRKLFGVLSLFSMENCSTVLDGLPQPSLARIRALYRICFTILLLLFCCRSLCCRSASADGADSIAALVALRKFGYLLAPCMLRSGCLDTGRPQL